MKQLTEQQVDQVEKALGFKLYDFQRAILTNAEYIYPSHRRSGRTLSRMLQQLLLQDTIMFTPRSFLSDNRHVPYDISTLKYEHWYRRELAELAEKLKSQGVPTAKIINEEGW